MSGKLNSQSRRAGKWIQQRLGVLTSPTSPSFGHLAPEGTPHLAGVNPALPDLSKSSLNQTEASPQIADTSESIGSEKYVWANLGSALRILKLTSKMFPPLEAVAIQLLEYFDDLESAEKNRREYLTLAKDLERILRQLNDYLPLVNEGMSDEIRQAAWDIQAQIELIKKRRKSSTFRRMMSAVSDSHELMRGHRRIEILFTQLQVDVSMSTRLILDETLMDSRLRAMGPAHEASYNSAQSMDVKRRACTENTRVAVMAEIWDWILEPDGPRVYWVNGMAGTGKTTIAYTMCAQLEAEKQLGANFFCSRALPGCRNVGRIIPTIAYQLARFSPMFKSQLCQVLAHDPDASTRDLTTQFLKLLKKPMESVKDTMPNNVIVLIDALDELDDPSSARALLKVLFEHTLKFPVKFFVTSRPDHGLYDVIMGQGGRMRDVFHLHEIEGSFVRADIETYLNVELGPLSLPVNQVRQLAEQSGRLFIYAATAVEYIEPSDPEVDHGIRLAALLQFGSNQPNSRQQKIDRLYTAILESAFRKLNRDPVEIEHIKLILWSIICAQEPLTATSLAKLLNFDTHRRVIIALKPLRSVLHISERTGHISTLHTSFSDFMLNPERSRGYACNKSDHHGLLVNRCFEIMRDQLRFNICKLSSGFSLDNHVPRFSEMVDAVITPELFYACQYWGPHLQLSTVTDSLAEHFKELMLRRLLAWVEVLTLKRAVSHGGSMLGAIEGWLRDKDTTSDMGQLVHDAWRFLTSFAASPASSSTPHIYLSALAFWNPESPIFKLYGHLIRDWIKIDQTNVSYGSPALLTTWDTGVDSRVNSIALSPDGARLVSGHSTIPRTGNIRVWDVRMGTVILNQFMTYLSGVRSVAFSNDGTRIVSGCSDTSIHVWDATTGEVISGPFKHHNKPVNCVAFSHNGSRIISGSEDGTIHVLDLATGETVIGPSRKHTRAVNAIATSPDGVYLVSGSDDHTIRVWELRTGSHGNPFLGHTDGVLSVAYSQCGTRIVSGSLDRTIRVWDSLTGDVLCGPLGGYTGAIYSVVFSPDGSYIVAGSSNHAICVYNSSTGQLIAGPFQGHSGPVNTVVVSSDGTRIFSGSSDGTISVWDVQTPTSVAGREPMGHNAPINAVSILHKTETIFSITSGGEIGTWDLFSGKAVAKPTILLAGSVNTLIPSSLTSNGRISTRWRNDFSIWDTSTKLLVAGAFQGHTDEVQSVAVSPDGTLVISGSKDNTVLVWGINTANSPIKVLKGHIDAVTSVAFSPDGKYAASGSDDTIVYIWNIIGEQPLSRVCQCSGHTGSVTSVDFSPDSAWVVSSSVDRTIRVWDLATRSSGKIPGVSGSHPSLTPIDLAKFSPDGAWIASSSSDYTIWIWDASAVRTVAGPFKGHTSRISAIAFSPNGTRIISGSEDRTIRAWDVKIAGATHIPNTGVISSPGALGSWRLDDSGWVLDSVERLLVWIPKPLRPALGWPCNPFTISATGSLQLPMKDLLEGKIWQELCQRQEAEKPEFLV